MVTHRLYIVITKKSAFAYNVLKPILGKKIAMRIALKLTKTKCVPVDKPNPS